ncbi:MAG: radical SAM protein [Deltaproteobacteria bacterium]|nr:radical SAM protein [Deltaproteobacteria bacterium]
MTVAQYVYGPVCSRRLGRSLGIDLVPFKTCSYDCIYCQLGRTTNLTLERREYVPIAQLLEELRQKLATSSKPDYITLAGSGEPTLNSGLGDLIEDIKGITTIPVAVLTNGSLLWMPEVRKELMGADLVVPSLDAGDEALFRHVNRPHKDLDFKQMIDGLTIFCREFPGRVWLEVFLLAGITGILHEVEKIAALVKRIQPERVQLNTVVRPPAEDFAFAVPMARMEGFTGLFPVQAEVITEKAMGEETLGAPEQETVDQGILSLVSRRPCPLTEIAAVLAMPPNEALKHLQGLMKSHLVSAVSKNGRLYYQTVRPS